MALPYWKVLIQPPPNSAVRDLPKSLVNKTEAQVKKYLKKRPWIQLRQASAFSQHRGTPAYANKDYDFSLAVSQINIIKTENKADICTLVIPDPYMIFGDLFETGLLVTIDAGWNYASQQGNIFEGIIHEVRPLFRSGRQSVVTVVCMADMIVMGKEEQDVPMMSVDGEEETDDPDQADPEVGDFKGIIKEIAKRNGFKCEDENIKLTPPFPKNTAGSPTQGPKMTDLQRLGELADQCYASFWIEDDVLWFASLTHIFDNLKPEYRFYFQEIDRPVLEVQFKDDLKSDASNGTALVDEVSVTKGRPRKSVETAAIIDNDPAVSGLTFIQADQVHGRPPDSDIIGYKLDSDKIEKLRKENPVEYDRLYDYVSPFNDNEIKWERIQEYFIEVRRSEHKSQSEVKDPGKAALKADDRALNEGIELNCPFGSWRVRPITTCLLKGLGSRYDGKYYIAEVNHLLTAGSYTTKIAAQRVGAKKRV